MRSNVDTQGKLAGFIQLAKKVGVAGGMFAMEVLVTSRDYISSNLDLLGGSGAEFEALTNNAAQMVRQQAVDTLYTIAEGANDLMVKAAQSAGLEIHLQSAKAMVGIITAQEVENLLKDVFEKLLALKDAWELIENYQNLLDNPEGIFNDPVQFALFASVVSKVAITPESNKILLKVQDIIQKTDEAVELANALASVKDISITYKYMKQFMAASDGSLKKAASNINTSIIEAVRHPVEPLMKAKEVTEKINTVTSSLRSTFFKPVNEGPDRQEPENDQTPTQAAK